MKYTVSYKNIQQGEVKVGTREGDNPTEVAKRVAKKTFNKEKLGKVNRTELDNYIRAGYTAIAVVSQGDKKIASMYILL